MKIKILENCSEVGVNNIASIPGGSSISQKTCF